jgi:hypothetical protein
VEKHLDGGMFVLWAFWKMIPITNVDFAMEDISICIWSAIRIGGRCLEVDHKLIQMADKDGSK